VALRLLTYDQPRTLTCQFDHMCSPSRFYPRAFIVESSPSRFHIVSANSSPITFGQPFIANHLLPKKGVAVPA